MYQNIELTYYHPGFNVGMQDIRNVWLLQHPPVKLSPALHRGALVYRLPGTGKRISYRQLNKGWQQQTIRFTVHVPLLPF